MPLATCRCGAPFSPQTTSPFPTSAPTVTPLPCLPPRKQSYARFFLAPLLVPEAFLITPPPFNLHKCLPRAASFKQLYRMRPAQLPEPTCPLTMGRIRYSTSVSGQPPRFSVRVEMEFELTCRQSPLQAALRHLFGSQSNREQVGPPLRCSEPQPTARPISVAHCSLCERREATELRHHRLPATD